MIASLREIVYERTILAQEKLECELNMPSELWLSSIYTRRFGFISGKNSQMRCDYLVSMFQQLWKCELTFSTSAQIHDCVLVNNP